VGLAGVRSPADGWERRIADPDVISLVAEHRGRVAALAVLSRSPDEDADPALVALLDRLYVEPAALVDASMKELQGRRFRELTLWTAEWSASRGFYEATGWSLDGATRETSFAGGTFAEVRYRTAVRA
jgi:hypothetical protein